MNADTWCLRVWVAGSVPRLNVPDIAAEQFVWLVVGGPLNTAHCGRIIEGR